MSNYIVRYKQEYMGELLTDSYTVCVNKESELFKIEQGLFSDPHVIEVNFIKMKSNEGE